jgi:hypothetical protein
MYDMIGGDGEGGEVWLKGRVYEGINGTLPFCIKSALPNEPQRVTEV